MDEFTEEQKAARELRRTAYHEAGHKIIHERFGGRGDTFAWKNTSGNPEEKAWRGQYLPRISPENMRDAMIRCGFAPPDLPPN